ncbi:MAG: hypothetical protein EPO28_11470 [Saprospiraceae bacterium]|nr:MAG: hypothetical protein EPO28_11470 [Saprospiraceae bacterium]
MKNEFIIKHESDIAGSLSCFDRIIIKGTLPLVSFAKGMGELSTKGRRVVQRLCEICRSANAGPATTNHRFGSQRGSDDRICLFPKGAQRGLDKEGA